MTRTSTLTALGLLAALATSAVSPALANGQSDKNNMRNLAIAGAAVAGYGLFSHNNTVALLGAAGAGLAGSQYEKDRHQQSQNNDRRYFYRNGNRYDNRDWRDNRNNDNRYNDNNQNYNRYNDNRDSRDWRDNRDNNDNRYNNNDNRYDNGSQNRHDNGNHNGWNNNRDRDNRR